MTLLLEIPKAFEQHFNNDKFQDSLERIYTDIKYEVNLGNISGNYEVELIDMLREAFKKAEIV